MNSISRIGQAVLVVLTVYCALTIDLMGVIRSVILNARYVGDFTVFWTAARVDPSIIYDLEAISHAQAPLLGGDFGARPFVNPPSFLPWLEPFSWLPFYPAFALWTLLGLTAFVAAARRFVDWNHIPLILVAPPLVLAVVAGQVSFFVAALAIFAITQLEKRPILAGALLALAATIKPQTILLAPLALIAGGYWRALISTLVTGAAIGGVCVLLQGPQLWLDWVQAVTGFTDIAKRYYLMRRGGTPSNLMYLLGVTGPVAEIFIWTMRAFGVALVIAVFRAPRDDLNRVTALFAGSLLCIPYAMPYETIALLIPAAVWLLGKDRRWWLPGFLMLSQLLLPLGVIVMAAGSFVRSGAWRSVQTLLPLREKSA